MLWCRYCNRELDERCNLCAYKKEAKEKVVDERFKNNRSDQADAGTSVCISDDHKRILHD